MQVYMPILDSVANESKNNMVGQMSIFDFMAPEMKKQYEISLPPVGEFSREELLAFEKEVLGVYLSGHPLEEYQNLLSGRVNAFSTDFLLDEETGESRVRNGQKVTVGGMITAKTIKYTKTNKVMSFINIEDLVGSVEALVFPKVYEEYRDAIEEDKKVLVTGRVSSEDERASKLIADKIITFDEIPKDIWLAFANKNTWNTYAPELTELLSAAVRGNDRIIVYIRDVRQMRDLTERGRISVTPELLDSLNRICGEENVAVRALKNKY